jgi:hypothetical protein
MVIVVLAIPRTSLLTLEMPKNYWIGKLLVKTLET